LSSSFTSPCIRLDDSRQGVVLPFQFFSSPLELDKHSDSPSDRSTGRNWLTRKFPPIAFPHFFSLTFFAPFDPPSTRFERMKRLVWRPPLRSTGLSFSPSHSFGDSAGTSPYRPNDVPPLSFRRKSTLPLFFSSYHLFPRPPWIVHQSLSYLRRAFFSLVDSVEESRWTRLRI